MAGSRRYPDNEMLAAILPLKDSAADPFLLSNPESSGWDVVRNVALSKVVGNRRIWHRNKEDGFRPKFAPFYQEQVNYRDFTPEPSSSGPVSVPTPPGGGPPTFPPTPTKGAAVARVAGSGRDNPEGSRQFAGPRQSLFSGGPGVIGPGNVVPVGIPGGGGIGPGVIGPGNTIGVGIPGGSGCGPTTGVIGPGNVVPVGIPGGSGGGPGVIGPGNTVIVGLGAKAALGLPTSGSLTEATCLVGGRGSWRVSSYDVGFEMSLVSDMLGKIRKSPGWQPSNINSENRSTLVLSREPLDGADKDDIDLPPRYFGRTHDLLTAVPTQKVKLQRLRWTGGDSHTKKTSKQEEYEDGIFKTALNITPIDKPIDGEFDQKTEEEDPKGGKQGFAQHDYVTGFPDPKVTEPETLHQGGWMFDARQKFFASWQDIIGIDAIENKDAKLPRYEARFDWMAGIAYIRHDAHFMKEGDDECVPPIGNGTRLSGRIFFTDTAKCASLPTSGSASDLDDATFLCGEMVLDTDLANKDTKIGHECGQWRPMVILPDGTTPGTYDLSWHHVGAGYYGPYLNPGTSGLIDVPTDPGGEPGGTPTPGSTTPNPDGDPRPPGEPVITPSINPNATKQVQHGWAPAENPAANTQRLNIFERTSYNALGTDMFTKPQGFTKIKVTIFFKVSDPIQGSDSIELNLKLGEWLNDRGPSVIAGAAIVFDSSTVAPPDMIRIERIFTGYDATRSRLVTLLLERRNDLPTPDIEVWVPKIAYSFAA